MPFGLQNAVQMSQRFMDQVLDFCYIYIDDVLIASHTPDKRKVHLCLVLQHFNQHGILMSLQLFSLYHTRYRQ